MREGDLLSGRPNGDDLPRCRRKGAAAGHTIGTHCQNHPVRLNKMPFIAAEQEINEHRIGECRASRTTGAVPPRSRIGAHKCHRSVLGIPRTDDLGRRIPRRRLDQDHSGTGQMNYF
jgi:hypothetical protein